MRYVEQSGGENRRYQERRPVAERATELIRAVAALSEEIAVWVRTEEHNRKLLHDVGERVKELTALHGVAQLLSDSARSVPSLLEEIASALPPAWQYPEITTARIQFDGFDYTSEGFASSSWKQACEVTLADGRPLIMEVFYLTEQPAEWEGPFLAEERRLINSLAQMLKAALDRRQAEEALKESERRVRDLAGRLILAQEEERMRIARELHDDVLQRLSGLEMGINKIKEQFGASLAAMESLSELETNAQSVSEVIRHLAHDLHPAVLAYTDLFSALRSYCEEFQSSTGIRTTLHVEGSPDLSSQFSLNLYRIAQEALRNIAKHSGSAEATVSVVIDAAEFRIRISDRGRGFILKDAYKSGGLGLSSMEERAHLLSGTLAIESDPGKGSSILLRAPLATGSGKARRTQGDG
jgi:two-component system, NarL family, sensor kinase